MRVFSISYRDLFFVGIILHFIIQQSYTESAEGARDVRANVHQHFMHLKCVLMDVFSCLSCARDFQTVNHPE